MNDNQLNNEVIEEYMDTLLENHIIEECSSIVVDDMIKCDKIA